MEMADMPDDDILIEPRPWYRYIESSNSLREHKIVGTTYPSNGTTHSYRGTSDEPSFAVTKCLSTRTFSLEIRSASLRYELRSAGVDPTSTSSTFGSVVQGYHLLRKRATASTFNGELQLLLEDFLLSPRLYDGVDTHLAFLETGLGGVELERDLHARRIEIGLDSLGFLFFLGQANDDSPNPAYVSAFRRLFQKIVDMGELEAVRRLCEPLVAKGKVGWKHDDELLLRVLNRGNLEVFRYILDLAMRSQPPTQVAFGYPDCTFEPLYVAIRLGHLETVEKLLDQRKTFEGYCRVEPQGMQANSVSFTPVTAAAYWRQLRVLRTLLSRGMATQVSLQTALNMAQSRGSQDIVQELQRSSYQAQERSRLERGPEFLGIMQQTTHFSESMNLPATLLDSANISWGNASATEAVLSTTSAEAVSNHGNTVLPLPALTTNFSGLPKKSILPNLSEPVSRNFGAQLSSTIQKLCDRVRSHCQQIGRHDMAQEYINFGQTWERGMASTISLLTRGEAPNTLQAVLDSLLVAGAIMKVKERQKQIAVQNFVGDLDAWRCAVPENDKTTFDSVAQAVWGPSSQLTSDWIQDTHDDVQTFHALYEKLGASRESSGDSQQPLRDTFLQEAFFDPNQSIQFPSSFPQEYMHNNWEQMRAHTTRRSLPQIPGPVTWGDSASSFAGDFLSPNEVFPQVASHCGPHEPPEITISARSSLPLVQRLFSSVAMGALFSMFIIIQGGADTAETRLIGQQRYSLSTACAILSKFVDMLSGSAALLQPQLPTIVTPPTDYLSVPDLGGLTPSTAVSSECPTPSPVTVPFDTTVLQNFPSPMSGTLSPLIPPLSPGFITPETGCSPRGRSPSNASMRSDLSGASPPEDEGSSSRPRSDPCASCGRTFSSVTNLRKHMRDKVCVPGSKSRFPCRNSGCERLLSTRWYRQQHEEQYCQFRRTQGGAGGE